MLTPAQDLELALMLSTTPVKLSPVKASPRVSATAHVANSYTVSFDESDGDQYAEFENPNWRETAEIVFDAQPWRGKHAQRFGRGGIILPN